CSSKPHCPYLQLLFHIHNADFSRNVPFVQKNRDTNICVSISVFLSPIIILEVEVLETTS
ncbi:MAG: hypothetical protein PHP72_10265, partial [Dysgonamonadaceae bacterium]|nr:hypothetical protein [Dysgonamonadaceae bacterium]